MLEAGLHKGMDSGWIECDSIVSPQPFGVGLHFQAQLDGSFSATERGGRPVGHYLMVSVALLVIAAALMVQDWVTMHRLFAPPPFAPACICISAIALLPWLIGMAVRRSVTFDPRERVVRTRVSQWGRATHESSEPLPDTDLILCDTVRRGYKGGPMSGSMLVLLLEREAIVLTSGSLDSVSAYAGRIREMTGLQARGTGITVVAPDCAAPRRG